jgi:hypothetical protein
VNRGRCVRVWETTIGVRLTGGEALYLRPNNVEEALGAARRVRDAVSGDPMAVHGAEAPAGLCPHHRSELWHGPKRAEGRRHV